MNIKLCKELINSLNYFVSPYELSNINSLISYLSQGISGVTPEKISSDMQAISNIITDFIDKVEITYSKVPEGIKAQHSNVPDTIKRIRKELATLK